MTRLKGSIPFEVVVVDDGSRPGCDEVMREFPGMNIHYYYKENTGPGDSRNYGMKKGHRALLYYFGFRLLTFGGLSSSSGRILKC